MEQQHIILTEERPEDWYDLIIDYFNCHELYYGHGTINADHEASIILNWAREHSKNYQAIANVCNERVISRKPLAYILGEIEFASLIFPISPDTIIPRSPIGELIEDDFQPWLNLEKNDQVIDLCTGSGCIAIAIAKYYKDVQVIGTDISEEAIRQAEMNAIAHGVSEQTNFIHCDLYPPNDARFKLIISNPPYVPSAHIEDLPKEYRWEPDMAFDGGADGLDIIHRLINGASERLQDDGILILEVGESQVAFENYYKRLEAIWLDFSNGGEGVCLITAQALKDYFS